MGYCLGNNYACCQTLKNILFKYLLLVALGRRPSCNVSSIYEFPKTDLNILYRPSQLRDHLLNLLLFRFGFVNSWLTISNLDGVAPFIEHQSTFLLRKFLAYNIQSWRFCALYWTSIKLCFCSVPLYSKVDSSSLSGTIFEQISTHKLKYKQLN